MPNDTPDPAASSAGDPTALFTDYLQRLRLDEQARFDAFRAGHADLAESLDSLHERWAAQQGMGPTRSLLERLASVHGDAAATTIRLQEPPTGPPTQTPDETVRGLGRRDAFSRYRVFGEIDRGGMGVILRAWDQDLRRNLAMKVIQPDEVADAGGRWTQLDPEKLARFLEEAQVTGQLDHPGIVPVHELGVDDQGLVYFTMRLVQGEDLDAIFRRVRREEDGWNRTRALGVIQRVCEAMAFAHSRKVVHRDLKPANIMVGRFGETYVMDWGLARILDEPDRHDLRIRADDGSREKVTSARRDGADGRLVTMDGQVLGTPAYMPPEQARGDREHIGRRSDVYSTGAILYELLCGRPPYHASASDRVPAREVLRRVREGPPEPVERAAPSAPPELVAICERAMARDPRDRFPSMSEMAEELRRFLEHRVVRAYRTGPWAEFSKWVRRNRATAAALGVLIGVLIATGVIVSAVQISARNAETRDLDRRRAAAYIADADALWPVHPDTIDRMTDWLRDAETLAAKQAKYERRLETLRRAADVYAPELDPPPPSIQARYDKLASQLAAMHAARDALETRLRTPDLPDRTRADLGATLNFVRSEIPRTELALERLRPELDRRRLWTFGSAEAQQEHDRQEALVEGVRRLADPDTGLIATVAQRRRRGAETLHARSVGAFPERWAAAVVSIADPDDCPRYAGLSIEPQIGLVPIRKNSDGLWEFWHILSGDEPRVVDGALEIVEETGIVLVLVPAGELIMGAQGTDPAGEHYDPESGKAERPVHRVPLDACFISKYEMTQAQWYRATGDLPSELEPGMKPTNNPFISWTHPVEHISWDESHEQLRRWNLLLPTEAQWAWAARGGTLTRYWTGDDPASLLGKVNFLDRSAVLDSVTEVRGVEGAVEFDDHHSDAAAVDTFATNPWGLHHVLGNVGEWTRDEYGPNYSPGIVRAIVPGTGEHLQKFSNAVTWRGGSFESPLSELRVTQRFKRKSNGRDKSIGVRPARSLDR